MNTTPKGFVLLYMVLILAAVLTSLVLAASSNGVFAQGRLNVAEQAVAARTVAENCGEQALMILRNATTTSGTGTLTIYPGTCTYTIAGTAPVKTISITATVNNFYKRITITTSQLDPTLTATWLEGS